MRRRNIRTTRSIDGVSRAPVPRRNLEDYGPETEIQPHRLHHRSPSQRIDFDKLDQAVEEVTNGPAPKRRGLFKKLLRFKKPTRKQLIIGSLLFVLALGGLLYWRLSSIFVRNNGEGAIALQDEIDLTKLNGEGDGRVNILLIGVGGENHIAGNLADSIMLVSIDPISKDAAMLSIPRDLYLKIPGHGSARINAAHAYGEQDNEGGGPELLKKTVSETFNIPIHYFVRADFEGFKQAIDTVGGIEVNVEQTIYDYSYPNQSMSGYEPFFIEAGQRYMKGETALKYARSRYSTSDFDRSKRQQQILVALKDKALSLGTLANPVKVNSLLSTVGNHVRTDLKVNEIMKLVSIAKEVNSDRVVKASLDNSPDNFLASQNIGGASVLVPRDGNFKRIQEYVRGLLVDGYIKDEAATITVLNGTTKPGLATETAELLKSYGYKVVQVSDAPEQNYQQTKIVDYSNGSKPITIRYLEQRFKVSASRQSAQDPNQSNITIILGNDYNP